VEEPHVHTSNVPEVLQPQVPALLEKHRALCSGHLGSIKATEHRIELKPGSKPVRLNPYRMGPRTRELIKAQVDQLLKLEVIEPSQSEWASPVVLIPKPDESPRFCIDYRQLNERTVRKLYPLPRMDACLDSLGDAQVCSTLNCNAGYWQIPLAEKVRPETAYTCHCDTYQCTRLPFGLCNAPATFQLAIDMILSGVKWENVLVYLDDLIIFSADAESDLSHLNTVLTLLGKHGVTLKAQKCHLFRDEVEYLGHVVRPGRLSVNEKNPKAIKNAVFPKTQTQLRSFLGMCNVNRRFTVDFAKTAKPLNDANSAKLPKRLSPPTPEEQAAFDKLREQLCHPPILAIPRKEIKFIIDVDASYDQLGCCLLQQQPDGKHLPVGYFSKGQLPAEKNYTVTEIKGLCVVWAVGLLRPYIKGAKFLTRCDHKALKWIPATTACANNRLNRRRILLSEFDYDVEYKPGPQHAVADALSRLPNEGLDTGPISQDIFTVGVTTRSRAVLDPRLPKSRETARIPLGELAQKEADNEFG